MIWHKTKPSNLKFNGFKYSYQIEIIFKQPYLTYRYYPLGQRGSGSNGNVGVLYTAQIFSLVSYAGHPFWEYSQCILSPADWVFFSCCLQTCLAVLAVALKKKKKLKQSVCMKFCSLFTAIKIECIHCFQYGEMSLKDNHKSDWPSTSRTHKKSCYESENLIFFSF